MSARWPFVAVRPTSGMTDTDLLGLILVGIAVLMFATGLILAT